MDDNYNFTNITSAATTVISPKYAKLARIINNKPVASSTLTIYANGAASGAKVGTITLPATLLNEGPDSAEYGVSCPNGITIVTTGSSTDWTIVWK